MWNIGQVLEIPKHYFSFPIQEFYQRFAEKARGRFWMDQIHCSRLLLFIDNSEIVLYRFDCERKKTKIEKWFIERSTNADKMHQYKYFVILRIKMGVTFFTKSVLPS